MHNISSKREATRETGYLKLVANGGHYVYDTKSNACVEVPQLVYLILDDFISQGSAAVRKRYGKEIPETELAAAVEYLDQLVTQNGMFRNLPKRDFAFPLKQENLAGFLASPCRRLTLNTTEQCNQRCRYCVYSGLFPGERTHSNRTMTWPIAKKSLDYFFTRYRDETSAEISFYGGEPLLNWQLFRRCIGYVRAFKVASHPKLCLVTNLTLLNDEIAHYLIDNDVHISVSMDGPEKVHDSVRRFAGGQGTYQKVFKALRKLYELDRSYCQRRLTIECTFDKKGNICKIYDYFCEEPFSKLKVEMHPLRDPHGSVSSSKDRAEHYKSLNKLVEHYLDSVEEGRPVNHHLFHNIFQTVFSRLGKRRIGFVPDENLLNNLCVPGVNSLFVSADGRFFTCENLAFSEYCIGSVETGIQKEKVRGLLQTYLSYRQELCQECWAFRLCSQCFLHTLDEGRISKERMRQSCELEKEQIKRGFKRFIWIWDREPEAVYDKDFSLHSIVKCN